MIRLLGEDAAQSMLAELPPDQRGLIAAHVIEERPYDELAGELDTSEAALRQRVSRSLGALRRRKGSRR
jgi:DNA-directed RNA polymerase specialized sigma24 family protein